jgi:inosine-uridine nucleoside N-ribohydrolase
MDIGGVTVKRVHLDTDLGGDPDDACALVMLLGWPDVEITGITTVADHDGLRTAYVQHVLQLAGRHDIPVASGSGSTLSALEVADPITDDERHWPLSIRPGQTSPPGAALDLLLQSIDSGATVIGIGCLTNLAMLEVVRPGSLSRVPVVAMGGWITPPSNGLPSWGPDQDWNIQWDARAAEIVARTADLTLATLPAAMKAHLRITDLVRLRSSGPLGQLLANQSVAYGRDQEMLALGSAHSGLPNDLVNFHWDPVTCAVALGWPGAVVQDMHLSPVWERDVLRFTHDSHGKQTRVLADIHSLDFTEIWLSCVESADRQRTSTT